MKSKEVSAAWLGIMAIIGLFMIIFGTDKNGDMNFFNLIGIATILISGGAFLFDIAFTRLKLRK